MAHGFEMAMVPCFLDDTIEYSMTMTTVFWRSQTFSVNLNGAIKKGFTLFELYVRRHHGGERKRKCL